MVVVFTLFYLVIPNREIKFLNALIGGLTAGIMFAVLREVLTLCVSNLPIYQTIYGAASVVPIFLVWTYLSWAAVLMGAVLTSSLEEWRSTQGVKVHTLRLRAGKRLILAVNILQQFLPPLQELLKGEQKATDVILQDIFESNKAGSNEQCLPAHLKRVS